MSTSVAITINILSLLLSAIAIWVSIWTNARNHTLQKRIVCLEEEREKDRQTEKGKASLFAYVKIEEGQNSGLITTYRNYYLVVKNNGLSEARNIKILLGDNPVIKHPAIGTSEKEITHLGPQPSLFRYSFAQGFRRHFPLKIDITWEDNSKDMGSYSTTLTE